MKFLSAKNIILLMLICIAVSFSSCSDAFLHEEQSSDVEPKEEIAVHFIDVGQGDCALIQSSHGNVLIDCGPPECRKDLFKYIDSLDITDFEYAIFTHPHSDHIGTAQRVIERYNFKNVVLPDAISNSVFYENLLNALEEEGCDVILGEAGKSFYIGEMKMDLFAPRSYYYKDDLNDMSVVCKLSYKEASFLFTGDAESFSERQMLKYGCDVDADVLKVGHHGSSSSSSQDFLNAVSPKFAIVSAGANNDYGHPHREVVDMLEKMNVEMLVTYEVGSIVITTDGKDYTVEY